MKDKDKTNEEPPTFTFTLTIEESTKVSITKAAGRLQQKTGENVSRSQWVRQAINEKLERG